MLTHQMRALLWPIVLGLAACATRGDHGPALVEANTPAAACVPQPVPACSAQGVPASPPAVAGAGQASSVPDSSGPATEAKPAPPGNPPAPMETGPAESAPPVPEQVHRPLRIALALGGGAARGFAHIGVIRALEAHGIKPDIVVGTSAGSLVGALYAGGIDGDQLTRLAMSMDEGALSDWGMSSSGFFKGESLQAWVDKSLGDRPIEKLPRKFAVTATDLHTGQLVVFERGDTGLAVRASSSVPGVFQPVQIGDHEYVDGGVVSPVPVRAARRLGADIVIAVDISARPSVGQPSNIIGIWLQTFAIMGQTIGAWEMNEADIVLIPALPTMSGSNFRARSAAIRAGEDVVELNAARIREVLEAKRRNLPPS